MCISNDAVGLLVQVYPLKPISALFTPFPGHFVVRHCRLCPYRNVSICVVSNANGKISGCMNAHMPLYVMYICSHATLCSVCMPTRCFTCSIYAHMPLYVLHVCPHATLCAAYAYMPLFELLNCIESVRSSIIIIWIYIYG